jgi:hypothetical protein
MSYTGLFVDRDSLWGQIRQQLYILYLDLYVRKAELNPNRLMKFLICSLELKGFPDAAWQVKMIDNARHVLRKNSLADLPVNSILDHLQSLKKWAEEQNHASLVILLESLFAKLAEEHDKHSNESNKTMNITDILLTNPRDGTQTIWKFADLLSLGKWKLDGKRIEIIEGPMTGAVGIFQNW